MDKKVLEKVNARVPFDCERRLALKDHVCEGRITREHAILYSGKRVDEPWAIVLLCAKAHSVDLFQDIGILNKSINEWIAISRMTRADEQRLNRFNWVQRRAYLCGKYGTFRMSTKSQ